MAATVLLTHKVFAGWDLKSMLCQQVDMSERGSLHIVNSGRTIQKGREYSCNKLFFNTHTHTWEGGVFANVVCESDSELDVLSEEFAW